MKFKIKRETDCHGNNRPVRKAKMMPFEKWDVRSCTEEQYEQRHAPKFGSWRSQGKNHSVIKGRNWIKRQREDELCWGIEINTPEDLIAIIHECEANLNISEDTIFIEDEDLEYGIPKFEKAPKRIKGTIVSFDL